MTYDVLLTTANTQNDTIIGRFDDKDSAKIYADNLYDQLLATGAQPVLPPFLHKYEDHGYFWYGTFRRPGDKVSTVLTVEATGRYPNLPPGMEPPVVHIAQEGETDNAQMVLEPQKAEANAS